MMSSSQTQNLHLDLLHADSKTWANYSLSLSSSERESGPRPRPHCFACFSHLAINSSSTVDYLFNFLFLPSLIKITSLISSVCKSSFTTLSTQQAVYCRSTNLLKKRYNKAFIVLARDIKGFCCKASWWTDQIRQKTML